MKNPLLNILLVFVIAIISIIFCRYSDKDYQLKRDRLNLEYIQYLLDNADSITAEPIDASTISADSIYIDEETRKILLRNMTRSK